MSSSVTVLEPTKSRKDESIVSEITRKFIRIIARIAVREPFLIPVQYTRETTVPMYKVNV